MMNFLWKKCENNFEEKVNCGILISLFLHSSNLLICVLEEEIKKFQNEDGEELEAGNFSLSLSLFSILSLSLILSSSLSLSWSG